MKTLNEDFAKDLTTDILTREHIVVFIRDNDGENLRQNFLQIENS